MASLSPFRHYLFVALENGPFVLRHLLVGVTDAEIDFRPDPDRFTLRESIAHLADFEPLFGDRIRRTALEDNPSLPGYDEGERAIQNEYFKKDWRAELEIFEEARVETIEFVKGLPEAAWSRTAVREGVGEVTLADLVRLLPNHDSYHFRQVIEWRAKFQAT